MINLALNKLSLKLIQVIRVKSKQINHHLETVKYMGKVLDLIGTRFISWLYQLLSEGPFTSYLISLSLSFLICKVGVVP